MGPLKRAWEYPMLFTQFQTDPTTYLEKQIALVAVGKAIDKPTAGEANIAAQIKKISQGKNPKTGEDLWRTLEWGDRDKCADDLLTSLQTLNGDLFKIVGECK
ncbi:MAG: hypothetical protein HW416_2264 [Chloroflexi bacterium]|nr:hypothetical protein [Chloroflexota bacterium]